MSFANNVFNNRCYCIYGSIGTGLEERSFVHGTIVVKSQTGYPKLVSYWPNDATSSPSAEELHGLANIS